MRHFASSGKNVQCAGGYSAFIPDPLPPEIAWNTQLIKALSDADSLVGRLAGEGGRLPNPHILMRPFIVRETVCRVALKEHKLR